jgi:hypothetical protein
MPAPLSLPPFDPPSETLAEAVAEQMDFKARLDVVERKLDAQADRQRTDSAKLSSLQSDLSRCINACTANGLVLERIEGLLTRLAAGMKTGGSRG